jgi:hypothetical protein
MMLQINYKKDEAEVNYHIRNKIQFHINRNGFLILCYFHTSSINKHCVWICGAYESMAL